MKPKKQKRIRAVKVWSSIPPPRAVARWQSLVTWSGMRPKRLAGQEPYYVIAAKSALAQAGQELADALAAQRKEGE